MAYTLTNTSGSRNYSVTDGRLDSADLDLVLIGRGYIGYGNTLNTNFLKLLENFSNTSAPPRPITGQLWYDSFTATLKVYNGSTFVSASSGNQTGITAVGTLTGLSVSGATSLASLSVSGTSALSVVTASTINAISISAGTIGNNGATLTGTISTAAQPNITSVGTLTDLYVSGTIYGSVNGGITVSSINNTPIGNATPSTGGFTSLSATGRITVNSTNNTTAIVNGGTNGTGNIGAYGQGFNTVFASATSATYADLAENYEADKKYEPGTIVEFGGEFEITEAKVNSTRVAGIISTNPAYLMNSEAEGNFILPVALAGRVPCKVIGPVAKGDMMVSAGDGYAVASSIPGVGTVVGKALENLIGGSGIIQVVVGRC
jgi:hypothetical protein